MSDRSPSVMGKQFNKYDSFSISHIRIYLDAMDKGSNKGIVFWTELKEALKLCETKSLQNDYNIH